MVSSEAQGQTGLRRYIISTSVEYLENDFPHCDFKSRQQFCYEKFQLEFTRLFVVTMKSAIFHSERRQSTGKYE
jgi:hypothetical protein